MMENLLPRHLQIIYDINLYFLQEVEKLAPNNRELLSRLSLIEEGSPKYVRMAHLAVVGSHAVNGVAALHSLLIKETIFKDFVWFYGEDKFLNVTNGITPRRWLHQSNPSLSKLITQTLETEDWVSNMELLRGLESKLDDEYFLAKWMDVKRRNKSRLAKYIRDELGIRVSSHALFDIQVKRIHEYKRQLMNILGFV